MTLAPLFASSGLSEGLPVRLGDALAQARPSGALWLPAGRILAVADLHLGKAARLARLGGALLPPYETRDTLDRLAAEISALDPLTVVCVGDSFDAPGAASALADAERARLGALAGARDWVWIAGNHDPFPESLPGVWTERHEAGGLVLRHVAVADAAPGEVSGHHHPKATLALKGRRLSRRCFLHDRRRVILPAFGAYAGGLDATDPVFDALFGAEARALLLGPRLIAAPRAALAARA